MGVFHVFWTVQMLLNRTKHHILWKTLKNTDKKNLLTISRGFFFFFSYQPFGLSQSAFTASELTIETPGQVVKYVQSQQ